MSIKEQIDSITKCDGLIAQEVRDWVDSITLSCGLVRDIDNHAMLLVTGTIRGPLRNEVERFLSLQTDRLPTPWPLVRDHVRNTFLSPNETDTLKIEIEKLKQPSHESVAIFNWKFRELANKAYPEPRTGDAERVLVRAYSKALRDADLAKKLMTDGHPENLDMPFRYTEVQASGIEMFNSLGRSEEPMEIAGIVGNEQQQEASAMTLKALNDLTLAVKGLRSTQDKMITKVAKIEAQNKQAPVERAYRDTQERKEVYPPRNGPPGCDHSGRIHFGYLGRNCARNVFGSATKGSYSKRWCISHHTEKRVCHDWK